MFDSFGMLGPSPADADNDNHEPAPDKWFQESVVFLWGDPARGFGGELRFGIHPNQGTANVYTFAVYKGKMIDRRLITDLPLPEGNLLDATIGEFSVRTVVPLMQHDIKYDMPDFKMEARFTAFHRPVSLNLNIGGTTLAKGHYDALGTLEGHGACRGEEFNIHADGFSDHSWGVRRSHVPASRFIVAVFDPEFYIMAMPLLTNEGPHMLGYIRDGGAHHPLIATSAMGYSFRDDWFTPSGCDAQLYIDTHRGYRLFGRSVGPSSTQPMGHGKLVTHAMAEFECGGRLGRGILESSLPRAMLPAQIKELGVDPASWWLNESPH